MINEARRQVNGPKHLLICGHHLSSYQGEQDVTCQRSRGHKGWHQEGSAQWDEQGQSRFTVQRKRKSENK